MAKTNTPKKLKDILPQNEIEQIIKLYQDNNSIRTISAKLGYSRPAITKLLEDLDIKTVKGNHYKYNHFNENFFDSIDTELKAYWLGFLYADGSISNNSNGEQGFKLTLAQTDEEILLKYKSDLESDYAIRYDYSKHRKNPNHAIQVICDYRSQHTADQLKKLGCVENKSLILDFPTEEQVPSNLIYHFIRGYFDGDGSIVEAKNNNYIIDFVGTEKFIKKLATYFKTGSIIKDKRKTNSWYFQIGGTKSVVNAYNLMYQDATRYMKRKYDKFQPLITKYNES